MGVVRLSGAMSRAEYQRNYATVPLVARTLDADMTGHLLALTAPVGPGLIRGAYSRADYDLNSPASGSTGKPQASKLALGYIHNLSKRTALYATLARVNKRKAQR